MTNDTAPSGREKTSLPDFTLSEGGGSDRLSLSGEWTVHSLASVLSRLEKGASSASGAVVIEVDAITKLDTAGALVINELRAKLSRNGAEASIEVNDADYKKLLETGEPAENDGSHGPPAKGFRPILLLNGLGKHVSETASFAASLTGFFGQFVVLLATSLLKPHTIRWTSLVYFMEQVGFRAIPIVSMLCFLIGMVVAYMCMDELAKFGAQSLTIKLLEVAVFREMGVLITAIVVAGRSSSSFTAQIGSMVANEEVAAIRSMGLDPMPLLVLPRVLALVITLPMLVFVADIAGILGGALAICPALDISLTGFLHQFYNGSKIWNFFVAFIKAPFCAMAIGLVGCYQGFQATSSSESVGFLTTVAVVQSIFLVIVIDAVFAIFFAGLGI